MRIELSYTPNNRIAVSKGVKENEVEIEKMTEKINEAQSWFFEKINKIDKPSARLIKEKRERAQINKLEMKSGHYNGQHRN